MGSLLVVDDEGEGPPRIVGLLLRAGHDVRVADSRSRALEILDCTECDLVLTNDRLGRASAFDIVEATHWSRPLLPVIVLAGHASSDDALGYLRAGAFDYVEKDEPPREILRAVQRALESDASVDVEVAARPNELAPFFATPTSAALRSVLDAARAAANGGDPVLIVGERGTGRRALARQIHAWSQRRGRPLVSIAARSLNLDLAAPTERSRPPTERDDWTAALGLAGGGTVVISHVGRLDARAQESLAQILLAAPQGGRDAAASIGRLVATCEPDLCVAASSGRFRKDLYRCLSATTLRLAPLRERGDDLFALANHFLRTLGRDYGRDELQLSSTASTALGRHWWPGNVAELRDAIERAVSVVGDDGVVRPEHLPARIARRAAGSDDGELATPTLEDLERTHIARVLARSETLEQAATTLGIHIATLWRKRRRYRLR